MNNMFSFRNFPNVFIVFGVLVLVVAGLFFIAGAGERNSSLSSIEVGVTSVSPQGPSGGFAIPASCPSFEHSPGECSPPSPNFFGKNNETGGTGGAITINQGGGATINWNASSATSCDGVNFSTGGATSGSATVNPSSSTTYTIVCYYNPNVYNPSTLQSSVGVTVLNPTLSISASPISVRSGRSSTITWSASGVDSCTVTGPNGFSQSGLSGSASSGALTQQSVFVLQCQNAGGSPSAAVTVTIIPSFEEF